jgi:hypothetical protein
MSTDLLTALRDSSPGIPQDAPALKRAHAILEARRRAVTPLRRQRHVGRIPLVVAAAVVAVAAPLTATNLVQDADELPTGFVQAHASWREHDTDFYGVDPATAEPLDVVNGPNGEQLHVYVTPGMPWCASMYVHVPRVTSPNPYTESGGTLSFCRQNAAPADITPRFTGSTGALGGTPAGYQVFAFDVGEAVRAEVDLSDGTTLRTLVHEHVAYGWLPPGRSTATLIGYDRDGAITHTRELP